MGIDANKINIFQPTHELKRKEFPVQLDVDTNVEYLYASAVAYTVVDPML